MNSNSSRRRFMAGAALLGTATAVPMLARAQAKTVKIGALHPVTGALAFSGTQSRAGATLGIADINAAGGIKSLDGMKIEAVLGDAQSSPATGASEVERMNDAGVSAIGGAYGSTIL